MKFPDIRKILPSWQNALLALAAAIGLILAFPDFEIWFLAWFAPVPLLYAIEREKESSPRSFVLGWLFGTVFFLGTCWWLTFAPINYAGFPPALAYILLLIVCIIVGIFPAVFSALMAFVLRQFGSTAMLAAPFVWVFTEFARYWLTGNNWNAIGYSQAFDELLIPFARVGGVAFVSWATVVFASTLLFAFLRRKDTNLAISLLPLMAWIAIIYVVGFIDDGIRWTHKNDVAAEVVALQPNVPMSGLNYEKWRQLRQRHVQMAETEIQKFAANPHRNRDLPVTVIFPESPMNFMYDEDADFQAFIHDFARRNNVNVLFNSAEPNHADNKYYNSAVMVGPEGREIGQYDKIYLVPFGESVPAPLQSIVPAFVGSFSYGTDFDLFPLGDAKGGVMICFESHFGQLSREYVRQGADVLIEMTNDGYLGPTPILRQHLANAVFRAVETNRPVLRVTNVGITAYINERGEVMDPAGSYQEAARTWKVVRSDGSHTFYVKYGDWFAWVCVVATLALFALGLMRNRKEFSVSAT
jgi:apolipoprotein N-acyltransferase